MAVSSCRSVRSCLGSPERRISQSHSLSQCPVAVASTIHATTATTTTTTARTTLTAVPTTTTRCPIPISFSLPSTVSVSVSVSITVPIPLALTLTRLTWGHCGPVVYPSFCVTLPSSAPSSLSLSFAHPLLFLNGDHHFDLSARCLPDIG